MAENRRRFAAAVGYAEDALFEVDQVHGARVIQVASLDQPAALRREQADGLVAPGSLAGSPERALAVRTADCVPVLLADPDSGAVAALHAGWRGIAARIVAEGVRALTACAGAKPERLLAALFPHIHACCFEVSPDVAAQLWEASPEPNVVARGGDKPHVDLSAIVRAQLTAAGVQTQHFELVPGCTRCQAELFFSFRRDGEASGRHLTAIVAR